jgi:flagellar hook-associated protein 2
MSTVGISFGSATSGTGFDVAATVSSLMAIQRMPETAWKAQVTSLQAQDAAITTLGSDLSSLSTALNALTSFDGALTSKTGASSDTTVVTLTSADSAARAGTHSITVSKLAQTSTEYSSAVPAGDTLSGSITLQTGSGAVTTIALDSTNNTLAGLAAAINAAGIDISANVVTDRTGSRLSLVSATSGTEGQITVGGSITDDTTSGAVSFTTGQTGVDAEFTVDGLSVTSSSNTVRGAIPGVTFQLLSVSSTGSQVEIANDTGSVTTALGSFVAAYNQLVTDMTTQEGKDASGNAEPLLGSTVLSQIQASLATVLSTTFSGSGAVKNMTQLGLTLGTDGKLSLESSTLATTLNASFNDVTKFFQNVGGTGQTLLSTLNGLGTASSTGMLKMALAQNADEETRLNQNTTNLETRLASYQTLLTAQLSAANQILQSIPQQLDEVKQIYAAITGYGNNG